MAKILGYHKSDNTPCYTGENCRYKGGHITSKAAESAILDKDFTAFQEAADSRRQSLTASEIDALKADIEARRIAIENKMEPYKEELKSLRKMREELIEEKYSSGVGLPDYTNDIEALQGLVDDHLRSNAASTFLSGWVKSFGPKISWNHMYNLETRTPVGQVTFKKDDEVDEKTVVGVSALAKAISAGREEVKIEVSDSQSSNAYIALSGENFDKATVVQNYGTRLQNVPVRQALEYASKNLWLTSDNNADYHRRDDEYDY